MHLRVQGHGVPLDHKLAAEWWTQAANQGHPTAQVHSRPLDDDRRIVVAMLDHHRVCIIHSRPLSYFITQQLI